MDPIELLILLSGAIDLAASVASESSEDAQRRILNKTASTLAAIALAITPAMPTDAMLTAGRNLIDSLEAFCAEVAQRSK